MKKNTKKRKNHPKKPCKAKYIQYHIWFDLWVESGAGASSREKNNMQSFVYASMGNDFFSTVLDTVLILIAALLDAEHNVK